MERSYNIPLRREWLKAPKYKRAKKAVKALREFLIKHMKSDNLHIGKHLNELIWNRGIKNPPHHVNVNVLKDEEGRVFAELVGHKIEKPEKKKEAKEENLKDKLKALKEKAAKKPKKDDKKEEKSVKKEEPKVEAKKAPAKEESKAEENKSKPAKEKAPVKEEPKAKEKPVDTKKEEPKKA